MKTRILAVAAIATLAFTVSPAIYAAPASLNLPTHAFLGKVKSVAISFHNDSAAPIELQAGDSVIKLAAGQTLNVHLPAGTKVISNTATTNLMAGTLVTEVASYLEGATINIK